MREGAILLARVSKKGSAADTRFSIPAQLRMMREYCEREHIPVVAEYIEPGTSAFTSDIAKVPLLKVAVERIEAGDARMLVVHESSRLARTERLTAEVADRLEKVMARFINVSNGGLDYSTPEGRMILAQEAAMNSYWSRKTREHTKKGKNEQFAKGLPVGQIPFGYAAATTIVDGVVTTTRAAPPVIVPHEADAILAALEDQRLGRSPNDIAREWTLRGLKPRSVKGITQFQPMTVRGILSNPFYCGYVTHHGQLKKGLHEPIVSEEVFRTSQRTPQRYSRSTHPPFLLQTIATCAGCGNAVYSHLVHHSRKDPTLRHFYYREPSRDFNRQCPQAGRIWRADEPDRQVEAVVRTLALDPGWVAYVDEQARQIPSGTPDCRRGLQTELDRAQRDYHKGRMTEEAWDEVYDRITRELAMLPVAVPVLQKAANRLESFACLWDAASPQAKNEACKLIFQRTVIDFDKREVSLEPWPEFVPLFEARARYVEETQRAPG